MLFAGNAAGAEPAVLYLRRAASRSATVRQPARACDSGRVYVGVVAQRHEARALAVERDDHAVLDVVDPAMQIEAALRECQRDRGVGADVRQLRDHVLADQVVGALRCVGYSRASTMALATSA